MSCTNKVEFAYKFVKKEKNERGHINKLVDHNIAFGDGKRLIALDDWKISISIEFIQIAKSD